MKKISMFLAALFLAALAAGCGGEPQGTGPSRTSSDGTTGAQSPKSCAEAPLVEEAPDGLPAPLSDIEPLTINTSGGERVELRVEIADDFGEDAQGLMFRKSLGEDCGMLFVYDHEETLSFWMRNTYIPLSIAYINSDGEIIDLQDMKPLDDEPPSYVSAEPAQYALEVNQGFFRENGVEVGDQVELPG